jgi:hypothetical protein
VRYRVLVKINDNLKTGYFWAVIRVFYRISDPFQAVPATMVFGVGDHGR